MDSLFELDIKQAQKGTRGAARYIAGQIRQAIGEGRLAPGSKLPPTRAAAAFFGVSRNTASEIYDTLINEGLVVTKPGAGTFVATPVKRAAPLERRHRADGKPDPRISAFWTTGAAMAGLGFWSQEGELEPPRAAAPQIDFRPAIVDSALFPMQTFRRLVARTLRELEKRPRRQRAPYGNQGNFRLRRAIQTHVSVMRGVACEIDDIVVTSGAQQAFDFDRAHPGQGKRHRRRCGGSRISADARGV